MNEEELIQETRRLIGRWDNVRVVGLGWSGDSRRGFQFNPTDVRTGGGGSGGTPPPPATSGACCPVSGDCFIATQTICEAGGGTYQGDDTTCDPDPCGGGGPTGACCVDTDCSIETELHCIEIGGIYQGDDTACDLHRCDSPGSCPPGQEYCGPIFDCCNPGWTCLDYSRGCCPPGFYGCYGSIINHCCQSSDQICCAEGNCCTVPSFCCGGDCCGETEMCIAGVCV